MFYRLLSNTTLYFQEIYLLLSNADISINLDKRVIEVLERETKSKEVQTEVFDKNLCDQA